MITSGTSYPAVRDGAVGVILLLAAIYLLLRAGARLYRNAVLHTGARLRLRQAWYGEPAQPQPAHR